METESRAGSENGYEARLAAGTGTDWLSGLMFCYNMPDPARDDCRESGAWTADPTGSDALMRCYNE